MNINNFSKLQNYIFRYFIFFLGLMINSFGIAFITKSSLGTSQISSIPYIFSLYFSNISFGTFTFLLNTIFIIIQILLLKKNFHPIQLLQFLANIVFSILIDVSMLILNSFTPQSFIMRFISLILGCCILAFGISLEVSPNVIVVPGEGIVRVIAKVTAKKFGSIKIYFDTILIIIAGIFSFLFFHQLKGIGIGTIISALIVGKIVNIINAHFPLIQTLQRKYTN